MTRTNEDAGRLEQLERLLDAWGGEPGRWPPDVARRIEALSAEGPRARALVTEARALDRLLDRARDAPASLSPARSQALTDRVVAAAMASSASEPKAKSGKVVPLPVRPIRSMPSVPNGIGTRWQAAGLMAASLLAGVYIGGSLNLAPVMQELAEAVGIQIGIDSGVGEDLGDEETL